MTSRDTDVCVLGNPFPSNNFTKLRHLFEGGLNFNGLANFSLSILTYIKTRIWSKAPPISIQDLTLLIFNNNCFVMINLSRCFEIPTFIVWLLCKVGFKEICSTSPSLVASKIWRKIICKWVNPCWGTPNICPSKCKIQICPNE